MARRSRETSNNLYEFGHDQGHDKLLIAYLASHDNQRVRHPLMPEVYIPYDDRLRVKTLLRKWCVMPIRISAATN